MQQYDSNSFFVIAVMFKRDVLNVDIRDRTIAVDIVAIATFLIIKKREEVVFYFLARILKNEERESRRKNVKDTPLAGYEIEKCGQDAVRRIHKQKTNKQRVEPKL